MPLPNRSAAPPAGRVRFVDSHVHVWAPPELSAKYPYHAQLIGTTASAPPVDGSTPRLLAALAREGEAGRAAAARGGGGDVGALAVQAGCHQFDHAYLTDALRTAPRGTLAGCALADPSGGPEAGVAALRALAALARDDDDSRRRLYVAVRFNPYLWPGHAAEPAGVSASAGDDDDDDDRRMAGPTGRALFEAAGELGLPVCFMPFKGLLGVADDIERLIDVSPGTKVVLDHFGFCACSGGGGGGGSGGSGGGGGGGGRRQMQQQGRQEEDDDGLLVGRSDEWRRLLSWAASRPQVFVKASAAMRASRRPFPHSDAALWGVRALVDAFGPNRVLWGTDWPWVEDPGTFAQAAAAAAAAGAVAEAGAESSDGWQPYGYEGAWRLHADCVAAGGGGGESLASAAPLTDEEAAWVFGGSARALFPGAWDD